MNLIRAKVILLCAFGGAGLLLSAACGGGGSDTKPASSPAEATTGAPAAEKPAPAASETPAASSAEAAAAPAPAEPAATPLGRVLLTDSHQIQKLYDTASAAPAAKLTDNGATGANPLAKGLRDAA